MGQSPEEKIADGILATAVELLALGNSQEKAISLLASTLPVELDPRTVVERVAKWQKCFMDYMRHGWLDSPVPPDIRVTVDQYFGGSVEEMKTALRYLPLWTDASHAKEVVAEFTQVLISRGITPSLENEAEEKLRSLPEPGATIALAIWKSPNQVAIRAQHRTPAAAATGCAGMLLLGGIAFMVGSWALASALG